ncbi:MFS-type transporter SLC18B1-like [Pollicipes pollicipes]|uniref:MFS-type transporter SLC18B1-like n=1 Tax=Pollicipes pollicipes TaxID=41117 RepID=UPI001884974A|nr:MFS-type transporter SLC18B1-like [Pollicipes pollicipes]
MAPSCRPSPGRRRKQLALLALVTALTGSLAALMFPFFPAEASSRGLPQTLISGVFSCFALTQLIACPLVGRLTPVVGVSRVFSMGIATAGVTTVVFGALQHLERTRPAFIAACFAVRMLEAVGAAAVNTCCSTIVASRMPERTGTAIGVLTAAQSVGLAVAPAVGGGLFAAGGFGLPFYVLGGLMLAAAAAPLAATTETWVCLAVVVVYAAGFSTFSSCLSPYAQAALGVSPSQLGLLYLLASGAYAVTSVPWGWLLEHARNPYYVMSACLLTAAGGLLLMPPAAVLGLQPSVWLLGAGMLLHETVFGGAYTPCLGRLLAAARACQLPDDLATRALVSSLFGGAFACGLVVGPVSGGALVDWLGFPAMMTALAAVTALMALLTLLQAAQLTHRRRQLGAAAGALT